MKKILFISPTLNSGGGERVLTTIMNNLPKDKYQVKLILVKKEGKLLEQLRKDIEVIDLKAERVIKSPLKLLKVIKIENPDIIFSGAGHLSVILGMLKFFISKNIKLIARERGVISVTLKRRSNLKIKILKIFYKLFLKNMDYVIMQSKFMKNEFIELLKFSEEKLKIINNPIDFENIQYRMDEEKILLEKNKINFLTVGRLNEVKQQYKMIELIKLLNNEKYYLNIVGEGELKEELENYAKKLDVRGRIKFWEYQNNPYKFMKEADLFLLTSKREAFPNVILEASACGLYTVAVDCIGGMNEVIQEGINGEKFSNIDEIANRIKKIEFKKSNKAKIKSSVNNFSVQIFIKKMEEIF